MPNITEVRTLANVLMEIFDNATRPLVIREIYAEIYKVRHWNERTIRMNIFELQTSKKVIGLKCPCGHSHMYCLKSKSKEFKKLSF